MTLHLVPPLPALIQKRQLEQSPNISPLAGQGYEQRHKGRIILDALAVGVEIDRPLVPANVELVGGDVLPDSHPFRERVAGDSELVGSIGRFGDRGRRGFGRRLGIRRGLGGGGGRGFARRAAPAGDSAHLGLELGFGRRRIGEV